MNSNILRGPQVWYSLGSFKKISWNVCCGHGNGGKVTNKSRGTSRDRVGRVVVGFVFLCAEANIILSITFPIAYNERAPFTYSFKSEYWI